MGLGIGQTGWDVTSEDKTLETKLRESGIIEEISRFHPMAVDYSRSTKVLRFSEDVTPRVIPTNERVQQEFELLLRVAALNQVLNTAGKQ